MDYYTTNHTSDDKPDIGNMTYLFLLSGDGAVVSCSSFFPGEPVVGAQFFNSVIVRSTVQWQRVKEDSEAGRQVSFIALIRWTNGQSIPAAVTVQKLELELGPIFAAQVHEFLGSGIFNDGTWIYNASSGDMLFSPVCFNRLGLTTQQGRNGFDAWNGIIHEEDRERFIQMLAETISTGRDELTVEYRVVDAMGTLRWMESRAKRIAFSGTGEVFLAGSNRLIPDKPDVQKTDSSNDLYRKVLDAVTSGVCVTDADGVIQFFNPTFSKLLSLSRESLIGKNIIDELPLEASMFYRTYFSRARDLREPVHFDSVLFITRQENIAYHSGWFIPLVEDGALKGIIITASDTTDKKRAEDKLRDNEKRLKVIIESVGAGIALLDARTFKFTFTNQALERMLGYTKDELLNMTIREISHPDDSELDQASLQKLKQGEIENYTILKRYATKGRETMWGELTMTSIKNAQNNLESIVGIIHNMTEEIQAKKKLAEEKERLLVTLGSINDAVITTDLSGKITLFSKSAEELSGWNDEEVMGRKLEDVLDFYDPDTGVKIDDISESVAQSARDTRSFKELVLVTREGTKLHCEMHLSYLRSDGGDVYGAVLICRDITERRLMTEELIKLEKIESVNEVASAVSIQFNSIMTKINGYVTLLRLASTLDKESHAYVDGIDNEVRDAIQLTQQIQALGKPFETQDSKVSLVAILRKIIARANENPLIRCKDDIEALNGVEVRGDSILIEQALRNIMDNAVEAVSKGGELAVTASLVETLQADANIRLPGKYAVISVTDNGKGIDLEKIGKIFDPFYTTKKGKSGMGLAVSYSTVRKHNGYIWAEQAAEKGLKVNIALPLDERGGSEAASLADTAAPGFGAAKRILFMDDEDQIRTMASIMLKRLGFTVETAVEGGEAVERYQRALKLGPPFDAVIVDYRVNNGLGGKETMQKITKIDPNAKVILSSGFTNEPIIERYLEFGFKGVLLKPYTFSELKRLFDSLFS